MRESDTYRAILEEGIDQGREEGRLEEARKSLLIAGRVRRGEPGERIRAAIEGETDRLKLERWLEEALRVESWSDVSGLTVEERP